MLSHGFYDIGGLLIEFVVDRMVWRKVMNVRKALPVSEIDKEGDDNRSILLMDSESSTRRPSPPR